MVGNTLDVDGAHWQRKGKRYVTIAHRGGGQLNIGSSVGPENTLAGFTAGAAAGGDWMETDVLFDSQGVPWCMHDDTVDRTTNGTGAIVSLTTAYVAGLDAGTKYSTRFAGEPACKLDDYFKFCSSRNLIAYPEIKGYRTQNDIATLVGIHQSYGWGRFTYWQSNNLSDLQYIRSMLGDTDCGLQWAGTDITTGAGQSALATFAALSGRKTFCFDNSANVPTAPKVATIKALGIVPCYAVADGTQIPSLIAMGIQHIFTDGVPEVMI